MPTPSQTESADLQDVLGPVWRRKWLLLAIVVMSTVGTYTASGQHTKRFRSSTNVFVANSQVGTILGGGAAPGTDRSTLDQAQLLVSRPVTERVIARLGLHETPQALRSTITAEPIAGSNFVAVAAEAATGDEAAALANAYAQEYLRFRNDELARDAASVIRSIRAQLGSLPSRSSSQQQRRDLQSTIRRLQLTEASAPSETRQTDRAVASVVPFTPKPKRDAAFALAISLGLALALAFGLERFDRRIKSADEVAEAYGVPLLSVIPHASSVVDTRDPDGKAAVPTALREAFRSLRTNVQLASLERPVKRILVASAISGEGKSMIIRNLALTYREWGLSVAVFEADLRRPSLRRYFGLEPGNDGLTSVLTGDLDIEDVLIDIEVDVASLDYLDKVRDVRAAEPRPPSGATTAHSSRFVLLPGGETPPNPQAVLAAEKTSQVLEWLSERFDVVLIDTPPLLAVTDAIPLLPLSDGVVLVTRLGKTEHGSGRRTVALAQLDPSVTVLGVVANDLPIQSGYGYGYGYYGQEYGLTSNHNHKAPKTES
jgi:non-specific protein-tyrosine kinase